MPAPRLLLPLALLGLACAGPRAPTRTEALGHVYADDSGLQVVTAGARVEQPLRPGLSVELKALADVITVTQVGHEHAGGSDSGDGGGTGDGSHDHGGDLGGVDAVSSASSIVATGQSATEQRFEGAVGFLWRQRVQRLPVTLGVSMQGSGESDYTSLSGRVTGTVELFERNLALSGFVGGGRDAVTPLEAPPGEEAQWPAHHQRFNAGLSLSQLLSPRLIASAGLATSAQSGTLSSPYRRARVLSTLFPEVLPGERLRTTGYLGLAWSPRTGTGLHLREGLYVDSWGVRAMAPEAALAQSVLGEGLVTLSYRLYLQAPARFYAARYDALTPVRSSDPRLGTVVEHRPGLRLSWTLWGHPESSEFLRLQGGYALSLLRHVEAGNHRTRAHVVSLGVAANL